MIENGKRSKDPDAQVFATWPGRPRLRQLGDELHGVANERREVSGDVSIACDVPVDHRQELGFGLGMEPVGKQAHGRRAAIRRAAARKTASPSTS